MSRKRPRVPGTSRRTPDVYVEIPTAGRPAESFASMAGQLVKPGTVVDVRVSHDDGCPCTDDGAPMAACTCEIVGLRLRTVYP